MEIQITGVNIRYYSNAVAGVQVHFQGNDAERQINLNGYIPLTAEEYAGNEALATLTTVVRTKLIERLEIVPEA